MTHPSKTNWHQLNGIPRPTQPCKPAHQIHHRRTWALVYRYIFLMEDEACENVSVHWQLSIISCSAWFLNSWLLNHRHLSRFPNLSVMNPSVTNTLQWRHNGRDGGSITGVSIVCSTVGSGGDQRKHQSSALLVLGVGNSPVTGEFPAQRASKAENVSIWWRHHGILFSGCNTLCMLHGIINLKPQTHSHYCDSCWWHGA